jgi:tryptophan synthase alpha chain
VSLDDVRLLKSSGRPGLVAYVTAGDPDLASSREIVLAIDRAGADVIEIGVPFSDPIADGRHSARPNGPGGRRPSDGDARHDRRDPSPCGAAGALHLRQSVLRFGTDAPSPGRRRWGRWVLLLDLPMGVRDDVHTALAERGIVRFS